MAKWCTLLRANAQNSGTIHHATKQDLGIILWAIDENIGTNMHALYCTVHELSENTKTEIIFKKKKIQFGQGAM